MLSGDYKRWHATPIICTHLSVCSIDTARPVGPALELAPGGSFSSSRFFDAPANPLAAAPELLSRPSKLSWRTGTPSNYSGLLLLSVQLIADSTPATASRNVDPLRSSSCLSLIPKCPGPLYDAPRHVIGNCKTPSSCQRRGVVSREPRSHRARKARLSFEPPPPAPFASATCFFVHPKTLLLVLVLLVLVWSRPSLSPSSSRRKSSRITTA